MGGRHVAERERPDALEDPWRPVTCASCLPLLADAHRWVVGQLADHSEPVLTIQATLARVTARTTTAADADRFGP